MSLRLNLTFGIKKVSYRECLYVLRSLFLYVILFYPSPQKRERDLGGTKKNSKFVPLTIATSNLMVSIKIGLFRALKVNSIKSGSMPII